MKFLKVGGALALGVAGWVGGAKYERHRRQSTEEPTGSIYTEEPTGSGMRHLPGLPFGAMVSAATAVSPSGLLTLNKYLFLKNIFFPFVLPGLLTI
jgi:hypothetical protein